MKIVDLTTAVGHIKQACEQSAERDGNRRPFFFLVGSGISFPPVPLASVIEGNCQDFAKRMGRTDEPAGKRLVDTYSHWFERAYPQPIQRQRYLRGLMQEKAISHANFRLAHLLLERKIANLIVTTNFDDFLARALLLFGRQSVVCDHPDTVERIDPEDNNDIQIIHVHGSYWFYDCCNLTGEIEERSRASQEKPFNMASLLDNILARHSPLTIGYGGWEGDVVMSALKRRLRTRLPYSIYWFCYRRSDLDTLPAWLKNHQDAYFVLPPDPGPAAVGPAAGLSADNVFDAMIGAFDLAKPELMSDPLGFFASQLGRSLPPAPPRESADDMYSFRSVIEQVEEAKQAVKVKGLGARMEQIRDHLRLSQYREAIQLGAPMVSSDLTVHAMRDLLRCMLTAGWGLDDSSKEELRAYDIVVELGNRLLRRSHKNPEDRRYVEERMAMAMVNKGLALAGAGKSREAIKVYDEVVDRFVKSREFFLRQQAVEALFNKAYTLAAAGQNKPAVSVYNEVVRRFEKAREPEMQEAVARALVNKGIALGDLNRDQEERKAYDEVVRRFRNTDDPDIQAQVAQSLVNKGISLEKARRLAPAKEAYREVIQRFERIRHPELQEKVTDARNNLELLQQ